jgi:hypothetical protein
VAVLWGLLVAYVLGSLGVLFVIQRRTPSDATPEQRRTNGQIVVGLAGLGFVLAIGIGVYFAM